MNQLPILGQPNLGPPTGRALFRLAFRPFYLLAAIAMATLVPLWLGVLASGLSLHGGLAPALWHAHEMIFGVVSAVVVGFLFTAGKTWTGLQTPRGAQLVFLAALWLAARITSVIGPSELFAVLDLAFLPLCAASFLDVLAKSGNRRNYIVVAVLSLIALANVFFHLANWRVVDVSPALALKSGLGGLILMETLIAGRVVPFFARGVNPGLQNTVPPWRERALAVATVAALFAWLGGAPAVLSAALLGIASAVHAWRWLTWKPRASLTRPILWSLYLGYAWIPVGFLMLAYARATGTSDSGAIHAFAVGATGGLLIAMMTRTARGHTARPLQVGRAEMTAYGLVALAAIARVSAAYLPAAAYWPALIVAAAAFAAAFAIYAVVYAPWLSSTRLDGKDG